MGRYRKIKTIKKILSLIKDYNYTYKPKIYDSKVDLKAVKEIGLKMKNMKPR